MAEVQAGTHAVLRILHPSGAEETLRLGDEELTIGRALGNRLRLDDSLVSRRHARIERVPEGWAVVDLGAKNPTLVNGAALHEGPAVLRDGDEILVGDTRLRFSQPAARPAIVIDPALAARAAEPPPSFAEFLADAEDGLGTLEEAAGRLLAALACERATILLVEEKGGEPVIQFSRRRDGTGGESPELEEPVLKAALTAERPVVLRASKPGAALGTALGIRRHLLVQPLRGPGERKLGLFVCERAAGEAPFGEQDLAAARGLGAVLSLYVRRGVL